MSAGKRVALVCLVALAACDAPHPRFYGVEPVRITIGKSTFDVRVKGNEAEAIRLNTEWAPRMAAVAPRAQIAIEKVSGCTVKKLDGDQAQAFARLKCGKDSRPMDAGPGRIEYVCDIEDAYRYSGMDVAVADMTCRPKRY